MIHDEIVREIQARASSRGLLSHYCGQATRCKGDRGLPDVLVVGGHGLVWIEVKTPGDRLSPEQVKWKYTLQAAGEVYEVMDEQDLAAGGAVDMILSFASSGDVAA